MELQFEFELWFELRLCLVGLHGDVEGRAEFRGPAPLLAMQVCGDRRRQIILAAFRFLPFREERTKRQEAKSCQTPLKAKKGQIVLRA